MIRFFEKDPPTLEEAQDIIGGDVEIITLSNGRQMLVNEDGTRLNLSPNIPATEIVHKYSPKTRILGTIVGPVIILSKTALWR